MALKSIKDMFNFGKDIELVTSEEEDQMQNYDCRYEIADIRSSLGYAQLEAANGYEDGLERGIVQVPPLVERILKSPDYPIDKIAFLERVIAEVEKVRSILAGKFPRLIEPYVDPALDKLVTMHEEIANPAPAPEQPALTM